jgi:hypothetical protein
MYKFEADSMLKHNCSEHRFIAKHGAGEPQMDLKQAAVWVNLYDNLGRFSLWMRELERSSEIVALNRDPDVPNYLSVEGHNGSDKIDLWWGKKSWH